MYQNVLGVPPVVAAAVILPNTGNNKTMTVIAVISLIVGVTILASSFARFVAKKAFKS